MGGVQARQGSQVAVDLVMRARACEGRECVREDGGAAGSACSGAMTTTSPVPSITHH